LSYRYAGENRSVGAWKLSIFLFIEVQKVMCKKMIADGNDPASRPSWKGGSASMLISTPSNVLADKLLEKMKGGRPQH